MLRWKWSERSQQLSSSRMWHRFCRGHLIWTCRASSNGRISQTKKDTITPLMRKLPWDQGLSTTLGDNLANIWLFECIFLGTTVSQKFWEFLHFSIESESSRKSCTIKGPSEPEQLSCAQVSEATQPTWRPGLWTDFWWVIICPSC